MHKLGAFRTIVTDLIKIILRPHKNLHHHFKELVVAVVAPAVYLIPVVVAVSGYTWQDMGPMRTCTFSVTAVTKIHWYGILLDFTVYNIVVKVQSVHILGWYSVTPLHWYASTYTSIVQVGTVLYISGCFMLRTKGAGLEGSDMLTKISYLVFPTLCKIYMDLTKHTLSMLNFFLRPEWCRCVAILPLALVIYPCQ